MRREEGRSGRGGPGSPSLPLVSVWGPSPSDWQLQLRRPLPERPQQLPKAKIKLPFPHPAVAEVCLLQAPIWGSGPLSGLLTRSSFPEREAMWPSTHPLLAGASQSSSLHPAVLGRGHNKGAAETDGEKALGSLGRVVRSSTGRMHALSTAQAPLASAGSFLAQNETKTSAGCSEDSLTWHMGKSWNGTGAKGKATITHL